MRLPPWLGAAACLLVLLATSDAPAQALKISQVFGGGGNPGAPYTRDYVELFNAGTGEVNLSGWSIQYAAAAGTTWQIASLPNRTIAPGGYFLVQMSAEGTAGLPLPTPDHVAVPAISMSSTSGKLALVRGVVALSGPCPASTPALPIADLVGFGSTASCYEGSAPAPAPSNTVVILRGDDGCADTGQNAADFAAGPANPRNSATSRPLCPGADLSLSIEPQTELTVLENASTFLLRVRNQGPDAAPSVVLTVSLPANAALAAAFPEAVPDNQQLVLTLGDIASDEEFVAWIALTPYSGTQLSWSASAVSSANDPKPGNSTAAVSSPIFSFSRARLFTGVKDPAGELRAVDVDSGASKLLVAASVSGLAADNDNRRFFITDGEHLTLLPWDTMTPSTPVRITGADGTVDGLAWHPARRKLLGSTTASIYEIDPYSGIANRVRLLPVGDFGGIDYDAASNRIIAVNNSTSTVGGLSGRGFYRINPYTTELTFLFAFPERVAGTPETDIDGCAAGGGRFYGITDQSQWIYRYQQNPAMFLSPLLQTNSVDHAEAGSTYAAEFYSQSPGANLGLEIRGPAECVAVDGQPLTISLTVRNFGPAYAIAPVLSVTLPAATTLLSSSPEVVAAGSVLTLDLPDLAADDSAELLLTLVPAGGSPYTVSATCTSVSMDPLPLNNTATREIVTQPALPAAPAATALISTVPGSSSVPGLPGLSFAPADFGRIFRSPSGRRWVIAVSTTADPAHDRVLLRGGPGGVEVAAREGTTLIQDASVQIGDIGPVYAVSEQGEIAFATDSDPDAMSGLRLVMSVGRVLATVAEQGAGNFQADGTYGAAIGSVTIQSDGTASFTSQVVSGVSTTLGYFSGSGQTQIMRTPVTVPTGQLAAAVPLESFGAGATEAQITWMNSADTRWCTRGDLTGPAATDICLIVDNAVRIQEGFRIPGSTLTSNVAGIHAVDIDSASGDVYCRGSNVDGKDWVWKNGQVIESTAAPIAMGSTEQFSDAVLARGFFLATGNSAGDVIVGGHTNATDLNANEVIVLNHRQVLLRENDAIDIDADGILDDDARIHSFKEHSAFISDDGWLYAVVRIRSSASVCRGAPQDIGQALIRKRVLCAADFNRDGGASVPDIFAFLSAWFAHETAADFDGDGAVAVPDIFAFLSAWFAGC